VNGKVAILGAGRLGQSLLRGFLSSDWRTPADLVVTARHAEHLDDLREKYGVEATTDNAGAVHGAGLVIIAVKPQDMPAVLAEIAPVVTSEQTLLSVAAGTTTRFIEGHLPEGARVVRSMPNAPALVHEGIAGFCAGAHARDEDVALAEEALNHLGASVRVDEKDMDAVTALSGSGPAYFFFLVEAMIDAGILLGLPRTLAAELIVQTAVGSATMLRDSGEHPVQLREAVTSPGGTTIAAIRELEIHGVRAALLAAIEAAARRSRELGAEDS
jgi:pyrroline-5-carboxylate reductase